MPSNSNNSQHTIQEEYAQGSTIQRSPHDRKNPYVMISKRMLHDKNLSPRTKGIFCFLLSHPDDWKTNPKQVAQSMGVHKQQIYNALDELIEQGYCYREDTRQGGKFGESNYYYYEEANEEVKKKNQQLKEQEEAKKKKEQSEKPKNSPCPSFTDTRNTDPRKCTQTIKERTNDICTKNDIVCESSLDKCNSIVLFDAHLYRLKNGQNFQSLTARRYAKLQGEDLQRLVRNIHYYEQKFDDGISIDNHERYIENAFKNDYAGRDHWKLPNRIYAEMMRQEHDLPGIEIKKTVVWLHKKDANRPESVSLSLPEETFGNIIDNYVKTMKDKHD